MEIKRLEEIILESGICHPGDLQGCSTTDIARIEEKYNINLPNSYKQGLLLMGKKSGFLRIADGLEYLLYKGRLDFVDTLPSKAFMFMHDIDESYYFYLDEGDDPPIRMYTNEEDDDPVFYYQNFFSFILDALMSRLGRVEAYELGIPEINDVIDNYLNKLRQVTDLNKYDFKTRTSYAEALLRFKKNAEAIQEYLKLIDMFPDQATLHKKLALIYFDLDNYLRAADHYEQWLELVDPSGTDGRWPERIALLRNGINPWSN